MHVRYNNNLLFQSVIRFLAVKLRLMDLCSVRLWNVPRPSLEDSSISSENFIEVVLSILYYLELSLAGI